MHREYAVKAGAESVGLGAPPAPKAAVRISSDQGASCKADWDADESGANSSPTGSPTIVFIDPKPLTRRSILQMLETALPEYIVRAARSWEEVFQNHEGLVKGPHLVVINLGAMGLGHGWTQECLQQLKEQMPNTALVVISDRDSSEDIVKALECGVRGYIPTTTDPEVAFAAFRLVSAGGTFVPADAVRTAARWAGHTGEALPPSGHEPTPLGILTARELEVIHLLCEGRSNKAIALELNMQESTVKVHVRNIMHKLNVANRTQAVSMAHRILAPKPRAGRDPAPAS